MMTATRIPDVRDFRVKHGSMVSPFQARKLRRAKTTPAGSASRSGLSVSLVCWKACEAIPRGDSRGIVAKYTALCGGVKPKSAEKSWRGGWRRNGRPVESAGMTGKTKAQIDALKALRDLLAHARHVCRDRTTTGPAVRLMDEAQAIRREMDTLAADILRAKRPLLSAGFSPPDYWFDMNLGQAMVIHGPLKSIGGGMEIIDGPGTLIVSGLGATGLKAAEDEISKAILALKPAAKSGKRGAPPQRNAKQDRRIWEAREDGQPIADLAREFYGDETKIREVNRALDAERKRRARKGLN
jgi:hypothetical protein